MSLVYAAGLWSQTRNNFAWLDPEPELFLMVEQELKFGFRFHGNNLWGKRVAQIMQCFILFLEPNWSGAGAKKFWCSKLEPEIWVLAPMSLVRRGFTGVIIALCHTVLKNGEANMRKSYLLSRNYNRTIMPAKMKQMEISVTQASNGFIQSE